jgi:hypothetical protein
MVGMTKNAYYAKIDHFSKSVYLVHLVNLVYLACLVPVVLDDTDQRAKWTKWTGDRGRPCPKAPSARGGEEVDHARKHNTGANFQGTIIVACLLLEASHVYTFATSWRNQLQGEGGERKLTLGSKNVCYNQNS